MGTFAGRTTEKRNGIARAALAFALALVMIVSFVPSTVYGAGFSKSAAVKNLTVTNVKYNSLTLNWDAFSGATGYQVYRAFSKDGTYSKVSTVTGTSLTRKSLTTNKTCYYKVRAYCVTGTTTVYSKYSSVLAGTPKMKQPVLKATPTGKSIILTWKKVSGAKGYKLYRATSKDGTYTLLKTTTSLKYTDKTVKKAKKYYYKVRAYRVVKGSTKYSKYSKKIKSASAPGTPEITAVSGDGGIDISWTAAYGAVGYRLYRATSSDGDYTRIADQTGRTFHDTDVTPNSTYYYKVRGYLIYDGVKKYGSYSGGKYSADKVIAAGMAWMGCKKGSAGHKEILATYNAYADKHGLYHMTTSDAWCATFVSACALKAGAEAIMPIECSCNRMMQEYMKLGCWQEDESKYVPKPGDVIMYDWTDGKSYASNDNKTVPHHTGLVTAVSSKSVSTIIEGNTSVGTSGGKTVYGVKTREVQKNGRYIRGYGTPKFNGISGVKYVEQKATAMSTGSNDKDIAEMKKLFASESSQKAGMKKVLDYIRTDMAPKATEKDVDAYYGRLVFDACCELGVSATIEGIMDESGNSVTGNVLTLDDSTYFVSQAKSGSLKAFEFEE